MTDILEHYAHQNLGDKEVEQLEEKGGTDKENVVQMHSLDVSRIDEDLAGKLLL